MTPRQKKKLLVMIRSGAIKPKQPITKAEREWLAVVDDIVNRSFDARYPEFYQSRCMPVPEGIAGK